MIKKDALEILYRHLQRKCLTETEEDDAVSAMIEFANRQNENANGNQLDPLVILRPLVLNYIKKKETLYTYGYTKECVPQKLDKLIDETNEMEAELLKKVCELLGAV